MMRSSTETLGGSDQPDGLSDDGEQLGIDEDQETIWTSDRKEPESQMDLEETMQTFGQPDSDLDLEPDQQTLSEIWTGSRVL
jgi:hypothetical protein